jgi:hypothetical protein
MCRRIAEWFGVELVMAADEMLRWETQMAKDVEIWKGMADEYGLVELTFGARPRPRSRISA